jgi:hypothetical protein
MQDSTPGWARYIEELEAQAARLRQRRDPPAGETPAGILAAVRAAAARLGALIGRGGPPFGG